MAAEQAVCIDIDSVYIPGSANEDGEYISISALYCQVEGAAMR